jgi:CheY-like chemotaxis protein
VAEDNAINQQVALSFLERLGYRADVAANGLEVLMSLQRQPYDVVLMDVQMPEMDGLEATRRIRGMLVCELGAQAQPRIIAMTANAMKEDRDICLAAGMDDYISKPVQVEELVGALHRCRPHQPQAPQATPPSVEQSALEVEVSTVQSVEAVTPVVLDPQALERLQVTLGKKADDMLPRLIEDFYRDADRMLGQAKQAVEQEHAEDLRRAAHSLKSTSATFGALALSAIALDLEALARDGSFEGAADQIARAETEFAQARIALDATQWVEHKPERP